MILESEMQRGRELLRQETDAGYRGDAGRRLAFPEQSHDVEHRHSWIPGAFLMGPPVSVPGRFRVKGNITRDR